MAASKPPAEIPSGLSADLYSEASAKEEACRAQAEARELLLKPGYRIAHYSVVAHIGAGGMGEVYRATDTKLNRDVALKVLPEEFAKDHDRMARFKREAQVLASLNHPNIAAIYGLEEENGVQAIVLELVDGLTLGERIKQGALPLEESLNIAKQIAEALESAHEQGVIHRDLKPANVKVKEDGQVKVLDFGLAKALEGEESAEDVGNSPTLSMAATRAGVILGTAAYMSPEQARGQKADRRADIWSFGVVLFEMLTGRRTFTGETISDILASVLKSDINWDALPEDTPPQIAKLLRRCLTANRKQRLQAIGEARIGIEEFLESPVDASVLLSGPATTAERQPGWKRALPWMAAGLLGFALVMVSLELREAASQPQRVVRSFILAPPGTNFHLGGPTPGPVVVSPDGTKLAFTARDDKGQVLIYVRELDSTAARPLTGTDGAQYPFWSWDSRQLGFFAGDKLRKIDAAGGPPLSLAEGNNGKGGTWNRDGVIVFTPDAVSALYRVPEAGGEAEKITELSGERNDTSHRFPWFLPDGNHFLFSAPGGLNSPSGGGTAILLGSLDGGEPRVLLQGESNAAYASGHILFLRERTLMARPFDPDALKFTGDAFPLAEDIAYVGSASLGVFSVSRNGVLAYLSGQTDSGYRLHWFNRKGEETGTIGEKGTLLGLAISPDGQRVAMMIAGGAGGTANIWIHDVRRNTRTRFTFETGSDSYPSWSPDGQSLLFSSNRSGEFEIYRKPVSGTGEAEQLTTGGKGKFSGKWSPDGRYLVYWTTAEGLGAEIHVLDLEKGNGTPVPLLSSRFNEINPVFSPGGRWLAYASDESGRSETYITAFSGGNGKPGVKGKWQVSTDGGAYPVWRRDGREIYFKDLSGNLMAVDIRAAGDTLEIGAPKKLMETSPNAGNLSLYDVTGNGQKFLLALPENPKTTNVNPLTLVVNWTAGLKKR